MREEKLLNLEEDLGRKFSPEQRLLCRVMASAFVDLQSSDPQIRNAAKIWLKEKSKDLLSFSTICEILGYSKNDIIKRAMRICP